MNAIERKEIDIKLFSEAINEIKNKELIDYTIKTLATKINDSSLRIDRALLYYLSFVALVFLLYKDIIDIEAISFINIHNKLILAICFPIAFSVVFYQYNIILFNNIYDRYVFNILNMINDPALFQAGLHELILNKSIISFHFATSARDSNYKMYLIFRLYVFILNFGICFFVLYCYYAKIKEFGNSLAVAATIINSAMLIFIVSLVLVRVKSLAKCF